ncbi:MAG: zinc-finger domain-containing protein [Croceibacterium sp.]
MVTDAPLPPPEVTLVDSRRVWCDGSGQIRGGPDYRPSALGHPRVYFQIDESGFAECGYCDRRFVLKGGDADRAIDEVSPGDLHDTGSANAS